MPRRHSPTDPSATFVIENYPDFVRAAAARRKALGLSQLEVDARAGWADSYCSKLEMGGRESRASNARGLGRDSLPLLLGALDARLVLVPEKAIRARKPMPPAESGGRGGRERARRLTPDQRRESARQAARARWATTSGNVAQDVAQAEPPADAGSAPAGN